MSFASYILYHCNMYRPLVECSFNGFLWEWINKLVVTDRHQHVSVQKCFPVERTVTRCRLLYTWHFNLSNNHQLFAYSLLTYQNRRKIEYPLFTSNPFSFVKNFFVRLREGIVDAKENVGTHERPELHSPNKWYNQKKINCIYNVLSNFI